MATFTKRVLSASTDGRGIKVVATATAGTTIHQAVAGTTNLDEIYLYAMNSSLSACKLTIEYGYTAVPEDLIEVSVPAESGLVLVVPGLLAQNARYIKAFAAVTNVITLFGFVNRITA